MLVAPSQWSAATDISRRALELDRSASADPSTSTRHKDGAHTGTCLNNKHILQEQTRGNPSLPSSSPYFTSPAYHRGSKLVGKVDDHQHQSKHFSSKIIISSNRPELQPLSSHFFRSTCVLDALAHGGVVDSEKFNQCMDCWRRFLFVTTIIRETICSLFMMDFNSGVQMRAFRQPLHAWLLCHRSRPWSNRWWPSWCWASVTVMNMTKSFLSLVLILHATICSCPQHHDWSVWPQRHISPVL